MAWEPRKSSWKFLALGLLIGGCAPAHSINLSRIHEIQTDQVSHTADAPNVNDCGYIQSGKFSCNGKVYTSQQLADLRTASASPSSAAKP